MRLPDPERSRVVLIGTSTYSDAKLPDILPVRNSVIDLHATLIDSMQGIIPGDHCDVLLDETDVSLVGLRVRRAARLAEDLLLVYFAGHGLTAGRRHELYLALSGTDQEEPEFTALEYDKLRDAVLDSKASTKIIILDCCFSGRALAGTMANPAAVLISQASVNGTYVLTSAHDYGVSLALEGEDHTAFTGRLLAILRQGVDHGGKYLTIDSLYWRLKEMMADEGLPEPQRRGTDSADHLALARNRRYDPANEWALPQPPAGLSLGLPASSRAHSANLDEPQERTDKPWRESLDVRRSAEFTPAEPARFNLTFWQSCGIAAAPVWVAFSAWLTLNHRSAWPVIAACVPGIASGIGWHIEEESNARRALRLAGWAGIALYVTGEVVTSGGWPVHGWIVLSAFLCALWTFSMWAWTESEREYTREMAAWRPRSSVARLVHRERWLNGSGNAESLALADEVISIPAVRFACLAESPLCFLAVAGRRLLLVAQLTMPAGVYSPVNIRNDAEFTGEIMRIKKAAESWLTLFSTAPRCEILVMAVVRSGEARTASNELELRTTKVDGVRLSTPSAFGDAAGEFLLEEAYRLDLGILSLICSHLGLNTALD